MLRGRRALPLLLQGGAGFRAGQAVGGQAVAVLEGPDGFLGFGAVGAVRCTPEIAEVDELLLQDADLLAAAAAVQGGRFVGRSLRRSRSRRRGLRGNTA